MSAATRLRHHDESMRIIVLKKSGYVSFANCGLPYYLGGVIEERNSLLLQTPESLAQRFELDVRVNSEVLSIDRALQTIDVKTAAGTETLNYDELILSPGATPLCAPLPGVEQALILPFQRGVEFWSMTTCVLAILISMRWEMPWKRVPCNPYPPLRSCWLLPGHFGHVSETVG